MRLSPIVSSVLASLMVLAGSGAALADTAPAPAPGEPTGAAPPPAAAPVLIAPGLPPLVFSPGGDWKIGFHGIVGGSLYTQDTPAFVLNGQGPLLPLTKPADGHMTTGGDVRQTRLSLVVSGPAVLGGATPKAVVEIDFFGLNSPGGYGEVSVYPRLRLAYTELAWGEGNVLRIGQDHELILALIPESVGHMAYPVTYWNGMLGWREPGITYFHTFVFPGSKLELALQVNKADWQNPTDFGLPTTNDLNVDMGQLSGWFAVEGRAKWTSEHAMVFLAGHYNRVNGAASADLVAPPTDVPTRSWDVAAGVAGLKLTGAGFTFEGSAYYGKNLGPLLGEQLQFFTNDVHEYGAWAQVAYAIIKELDISALGGTSQLNKADVQDGGGGRLSNAVVGGMLRYRMYGFTLGLEYYHVMAVSIAANGTGAPSGAGAPNGNIDVNQGMLSAMFFF